MKDEQNADTAEHPLDLVVMRRDASFWSKPGRAYCYHIPTEKKGPYGHFTAKCSSRIQLDDENVTTLGKAGRGMCKRCIKAA